MPRRLRTADWIAAGVAALGVVVAFLPWYGYDQGQDHVTVNGFRASLFGDLFFLAIASSVLLLLIRFGLVADLLSGRVTRRTVFLGVAGVAVFCVFVQLLLDAAGHRSTAPGLILALLVGIGLCAIGWTKGQQLE